MFASKKVGRTWRSILPFDVSGNPSSRMKYAGSM